MVNRAELAAGPGERWAKTTCNGCVSQTCGMRVLVRNGIVVKVVGDPENPFNKGRLCAKAHSMVFAVHDPKRIRRPMKRTNPQKGKGMDPKWVEISYQEAYDTVARALKEQRQRDPTRLMVGNVDFTTNQWAQSLVGGAWRSPHQMAPFGGYCGNSLHAQHHLYQATFHVIPDWKYVKYLILMGSQKGANINHASLTSAIEMAEVRSRGAKVVSVDPLATNMTSKATEWLPIRPGTDGALLLAWMNVLANELRIFDAEFLRTYTNAPYLIKEDGRYLRDPATNKPLMWDEASGMPKVYDDASLERPALEGKYRVRLSNGKAVETQTAFEVFKDWVRSWTPERVSEITTIPVDTIRRIAREYGEAASIGSTIVIDGEVLPFRPAAIHWYRGISCHSNAYNTGRLMETLITLVGAVDVPGGVLGESVYMDPPGGLKERSLLNGDKSGYADAGDGILGPSGGPVFARLGTRWGGGTPTRLEHGPDGYLTGRVNLFPATRMGGGFWGLVGDMLHPERHGKTVAQKLPETILLIWSSSFLTSYMDPEEMVKVYQQAKFVACVVSFIDEAAEFADILVPSAHFLERLEPFCNPETNFCGATYDSEHYCFNIRAPVIESDIPHHLESWFELADRVGILHDVNEYLNVSMDLRGEYRLDPEKKYSWRELMGRWTTQRLGRSLDDVLAEGQGHIKWKKNVKERYPRVFFKNSRIPFYEDRFVDWKESLDKVLKEMGIDWWDTRAYTPLPGWFPCKAWERKDKGEFDLVTVTYKVPFIQAQFGLSQPWAAELAGLHPYVWKIWMNSETAARKGLADGDWVRIESNRNGKVVEGQLKVSECVHPEIIGVASHGGHWAINFRDARNKGMAAWPHLLYASHEYMDFMQGQPDHCVSVKVTKATSPHR